MKRVRARAFLLICTLFAGILPLVAASGGAGVNQGRRSEGLAVVPGAGRTAGQGYLFGWAWPGRRLPTEHIVAQLNMDMIGRNRDDLASEANTVYLVGSDRSSTTGLHPDYHTNTDEVSKIEFDKLTRVTHLVYETGLRLANLDHAPARDSKGPRAGKDTR
jgi:hypothetical protein